MAELPQGETDLAAMLQSLKVSRREAPVTVVTLPQDSPDLADLRVDDQVLGLLVEAEGVTVIATIAEAERRGWPIGFVAAWLTLEVHSALEAVGLTAAFSAALGDHAIPCNVLAGFFHDHLLVPVDRAAEAVAVLESLAG